ncbi:MAG: type II toxin-antitoxin system RelE/ParE family toxin [Candidatus Tectomicrobia bacterium]|uniref:Type II toxin-antitoxin system RelE/ParE family toxin n=1 Tax=Tectimicrobiota bacterium TaxID=2528274 RepID=A0A932I1Y3_UNCTE|nr:type II toxin-antitoxin system RelE/ParE family toxin [Candidatus Tectomicrobia bacterium]
MHGHYRVELAESAKRDLKKVSPQTKEDILTAIEELAEEPRPVGCKKVRGADAYRIRVGAYRVIYQIFDVRLLILVVRVGHRREVYRGFG